MQTENRLLNDFISRLEILEDSRRKEGKRHNQSFVLLIVLFSTMSGYLGYRAIGDFIKKHKWELIKLFKPEKDRVPSFSTVRRVLKKLNPSDFQDIYQDWLVAVQKDSQSRCADSTDSSKNSIDNWHPVDGKAVRGAGSIGQEDYVHLVSIFSAFDKIVVDSAKVNSKTNEIPCVQTMIQKTDLKGVIFTLDALHCQKKTVEVIHQTGNDYVIAVKKNQPDLYQKIEKIFQEEIPMDMDYTLEKNRGRIEHRSVFIYNAIGIDLEVWKGLRQVVAVERKVEHKNGHVSYQQAFYIDSTGKTALELNQGIRKHWSVESMHWVKDVVFKEDASKIRTGNAPEIFSIIKNWVMALFTVNGHKSMTTGVRIVANDLNLMTQLIE